MPETETIQVMGRGANVDFTIDDTVPYETAVQGLRSYLAECNGLYSRGTISVNVGRRILEAAELSGIKRILDQESGLTVSRYWCAPEIIEEALNSPPKAAVPNGAGDGDRELDEALAPEDGAPAGERRGHESNGVKAVEGAAGLPDTAGVVDEPAVTEESAGSATGAAVEAAAVVAEPSATEVAEAVTAAVVDETAVARPAATDPAGGDSAADAAAAADDAAAGVAEERAAVVDPAGDDGAALPVADDDGGDVGAAGEMAVSAQRGAPALIIKTTCRSGEVIRYPGDVVAMADVNPGAEIIADGDIVVFGALRGLAHAGAAGDLKATIIALNLESHRVQIGPHIGEAPARVRRSKSQRGTPQVAYVRRRSIFVAPFTRRQEDYQGGILYEG